MIKYLLIIRPFNCLFIGLAIYVGAVLNNPDYSIIHTLFAVVSGFLIGAAGYVINDFFDLPIDAVNRPERMLPKGLISPKIAYLYSVFLFILGLAMSFLTGSLWAILIALTNIILLFYYAKRLKRVMIVGNLTVAYTTASVFLFGSIVTGNFDNVVSLIVLTFLYTIVREIVKDAEDVEGDAQYGVKTLANQYGCGLAIAISFAVALLVFLGIYFFYELGYITARTFWILTFFYMIPLLLIYHPLLKKREKNSLNRAAGFIKTHMLFLLLILVVV